MDNTTVERIKMVKAMEFLVRQVNVESFMDMWLTYGVPDGDIEYGDLSVTAEDEEKLSYFIEDESNFGELMNLFVSTMAKAYKDGGLYCTGVESD